MSDHLNKINSELRLATIANWRLLLLAGLFLAFPAFATALPNLEVLAPRGAKRGKTVTLDLYGSRMDDARDLVFYEPGLRRVGDFKKLNKNRWQVELEISADCRIGEHTVHLRCASGISEMRTFWVSELDEIRDKEPNNSAETAQSIQLNQTAQGLITREDVDQYKIKLTKGQLVKIECEGLRLATTMFDPALKIFDSKGFILAEADDSPFGKQDPVLQFLAPKTDTYTIAIHESAYRGDIKSVYRLHVGTFPRPTITMPLGMPTGQTQSLQFRSQTAIVGSNSVTIPKDWNRPFFPTVYRSKAGASPNPIKVRVSSLENLIESKNNNDRPKQVAKVKATKLPIAINGQLEKSRDLDYFPIYVEKNKNYNFEVFAQRLGSSADVVLTLHNEKGRYVTGNDDRLGHDSQFNWRAPTSGKFYIRVRDHLWRSGVDSLYRIEITQRKPSLALSIPRFGRRGQRRQQLSVARNNRMAIMVDVNRQNHRGDTTVQLLNLPSGVKADIPVIKSAVRRIPIVFHANKEVKEQAFLIAAKAQTELKNKKLIFGDISQTTELIYGPPNNRLYWSRLEKSWPAAACAELPFSIDITHIPSSFILNGRGSIKVTATRQKGFNEPIRLEVIWNPPGVSSNRSRVIQKNKNEQSIPINVNNKAIPGEWPLVVIARSRIRGNEHWVSSKMHTMKIVKAPINLSFKRSATEQGKAVSVVAEIKPGTGLKSAAQVKLVNLPPGCKAGPAKLSSDSKTAEFEIEVAANARLGRHKNIAADIYYKIGKETLVQRSGRLELRVDRPRKPKNGKASKPKPKKPKKPSSKPMSRLEKLRKAYKEAHSKPTKETDASSDSATKPTPPPAPTR